MTDNLFGSDFSAELFLRETWQQRPHLWRGAALDLIDCIDHDTIMELGCDQDFDSRVVTTHRNGTYSLEEGPFPPGFCADLAEPWTLLVQEVDHVFQDLASLRQGFNFISSWRFDDVMVSTATDGAGVGPHYDSYDVFLVQTSGRRTWRLRDTKASSDELIPHSELKLLPPFEGKDIHLSPGDILYIPPGTPHWGISEGASISLSFGFYTPKTPELLIAYAESRADDASTPLKDELLFGPLKHPSNFSYISDSVINKFREAMITMVSDDTNFPLWLGKFLTSARRHARSGESFTLPTDLSSMQVRLHSFAKLVHAQLNSDSYHIFCCGSATTAPHSCRKMVESLSRNEPLSLASTEPAELKLLQWLANLGAIELLYT